MATPLYQIHAIGAFGNQTFVANGITSNTKKPYPVYVPLNSTYIPSTSQPTEENKPLLFTVFEAKLLLMKAYGNTQHVEIGSPEYKLSLVESTEGTLYTTYIKERENENRN